MESWLSTENVDHLISALTTGADKLALLILAIAALAGFIAITVIAVMVIRNQRK
jgi:nitrate reductase gamma subunit